MAQELDQAARRRNAIMSDQWGRKWETTIDITDPALAPCAPINPKGWIDRLDTPASFKKIARDEDGRPGLLIDIDKWIEDREQAIQRYDQQLYDDAMMLFGENGPKAYEERIPALLKYTGLGPEPVELLYALKDGNSYILGKTNTPDPRLTKFFRVRNKVRPTFRDEDLTLEEAAEETHDPEALGTQTGRPVKVKAPRKPQAA